MPRVQTFLLVSTFIVLLTEAQVNFDSDLAAKRQNHRPREVSASGISTLANLPADNNLVAVLEKLLVERVVGTPGHERVKTFLVDYMRNLGWTVEIDAFEDDVPIFNRLRFENVIATLNPNAERFLVLACHYDSKYFKDQVFIGATDSAVPCAMLLELAHSLDRYLQQIRGRNDVSLQLIFFDGEEAFQQWGPKDSIYGARHLAERWEAEDRLKRMDMLVLLDLLGVPEPTFYSYFQNTEPWYSQLFSSEQRLHQSLQLENYSVSSVAPSQRSHKYFQPHSYSAYIEDDHIPFLRRNVPILHIIPSPFPDVWHKLQDNGAVVDLPTVRNLVKIFRVFIAEYLHLNI